MTTSRKRCLLCKSYGLTEEMYKNGLSYFCNKDHYVEHALKDVPKLIDKGYKKMAVQAKKEQAHRKKKLRDTDRSWHLKEAQKWFNKFIRLRDAGNPCISCQRNTGAKMNAGHFRSVGACPELRFNEFNVHIQCEHCNSFKSGNIGEYRPNLINKIGVEMVMWIEGPHPANKYTIDDLKEIISIYKTKCKDIAR